MFGNVPYGIQLPLQFLVGAIWPACPTSPVSEFARRRLSRDDVDFHCKPLSRIAGKLHCDLLAGLKGVTADFLSTAKDVRVGQTVYAQFAAIFRPVQIQHFACGFD